VRRFWKLAMEANVTGQAAMVAYNMLLAVVPVLIFNLRQFRAVESRR